MDNVDMKFWANYAQACDHTRAHHVEPRSVWFDEWDEAATPEEVRDHCLAANRDAIIDACLGMVGELAEFTGEIERFTHAIRTGDGDSDGSIAADIVDEAGDVFWYCAEMCDAMGHIMTPRDFGIRSGDGTVIAMAKAGELCDAVKKWFSQGHDLDVYDAAEAADEVACYVATVCAQYTRRTPADIAARNIEKLAKRYQGGAFSVELSRNRTE